MSSRFARVRDYELMVILHPEIDDDAIDGSIERIQTLLESVDATVTVVNRATPWGRRRLAYPIRHEGRDLRDGIYVLYYFSSEASRLAEFEREMKLNTQVIRYLMTLQEAPTMEPTPPVEEGSDEGAPEGGAEGDGQAAEGAAAPAVAESATPASAGASEADSDDPSAPVSDDGPAADAVAVGGGTESGAVASNETATAPEVPASTDDDEPATAPTTIPAGTNPEGATAQAAAETGERPVVGADSPSESSDQATDAPADHSENA